MKPAGLAAIVLMAAGVTQAQTDVAGKWQGRFDSQIGPQKYIYTFKVDGTNLTGRAFGIRENGTNDVVISDGKIDGDKISFVEPLKFDDSHIRIEYTGTVSGNEIKLHRTVGDFAEENLAVKRVKPGETPAGESPQVAPATNSSSAK